MFQLFAIFKNVLDFTENEKCFWSAYIRYLSRPILYPNIEKTLRNRLKQLKKYTVKSPISRHLGCANFFTPLGEF